MNNVQNMDIMNIPKEKFQPVNNRERLHDKKLETKPISAFQDAMIRFCKNKGAIVGAIVIAILVLFSIIAPFFTPYDVSHYDYTFAGMSPKNDLFKDTGFWDGCADETEYGYFNFVIDDAVSKETGNAIIKNNEYTRSEDGELYIYRRDTYYGTMFGDYIEMGKEEYLDIQEYQNQTGRQVLYPVVKKSDRPYKLKGNMKEPLMEYVKNANIYFKVTVGKGNKLTPDLDTNGNYQVNYWSYNADKKKPGTAAEYNSIRIEGTEGALQEDGSRVYYVYGTQLSGLVEVRVNRYEYFRYQHGFEPSFLFGTDKSGKDIFTCLASGARFSFIFAIVVAVVNLFVGAIWGSIAGYFGGKIDLAMERFTDVLGAVPTMIVITLLKYHLGPTMGELTSLIALFITFFMTGWIGMASTTRMQFYRYKKQEYVLAARTLGAKDSRIMFKHIFPNAIGTIITSFALVIPSMIYSETNLTYLNIVNLEAGNITSVGTLIAAGQGAVTLYPHMALFPCAFLVLLMLSFNLFGNGLRDAFNPSLRGAED